MSSAVVHKRLISSEEYHKMGETGLLKPGERVELIKGEIINMSPIGKKHASIVDELVRLLVSALAESYIVRIQNPIHIDIWNEVQPDISILKYKDGKYKSEVPGSDDIEAIIEVSDTSYDFDKSVKLSLYASSGIPVYWIVDLSNDQIEEYTNPRESQYNVRVLHHPGDKIILLGKTFEVSEIMILP